MSFQNKNLFHLLGNDVEDEEPSLAPRELVKNNTSSKKKDEAPKADPSKAKKKKPVTGNEGAIKEQLNNKEVPGPSSTPTSHYKKSFDRHATRTHKGGQRKPRTDPKDGEATLEDELDGEQDAEEEEAAAEVVDQTPKKSLEDYMAELKLAQATLDGQKAARTANEGAEGKWTAEELLVKQQEEYVPASVEKKIKQKAAKGKKFLEFDATFDAPSAPRPASSTRGSPRGGRGAARGATRGARGASRGARGDSKPATSRRTDSKVALDDDKKFPSL